MPEHGGHSSEQWSKQTEAAYFARIGAGGLSHSVGKPFSDAEAGRLLMDIGVVLTLLPPPPARVIDWGCGTGWTTAFLGHRGYQALGLDLSPEAVAAARDANKLSNVQYRVHDFEQALDEEDGYDACVFFDSLHHSADEEDALRAAWASLKVGGVVVACEPGIGHANSPSSVAAVQQFGVRERDMPPVKIVEAGRRVGFQRAAVFPHPHVLHRNLYAPPHQVVGLRQRFLATRPGLAARMFRAVFRARGYWGVVVLEK